MHGTDFVSSSLNLSIVLKGLAPKIDRVSKSCHSWDMTQDLTRQKGS